MATSVASWDQKDQTAYAFRREAGITQTHGEPGWTVYEQVGARPTFEINGMWSGYIGEGAKTVLPSFAAASTTSGASMMAIAMPALSRPIRRASGAAARNEIAASTPVSGKTYAILKTPLALKPETNT